MSNYIQTSPWGAQVDDLGAVFGRLMLNMAQMRAQQDLASQQQAYNQQRLGLEREKMAGEVPLIKAQTEAQTAGAARDNAQTEQMKAMLAEALKFGAAQRGAFAPAVDMSQGPTMEASRNLSLGDLLQSRGVLTGLNPSVLARAVDPVIAGQGTVVGDPLTGREIMRGQKEPARPYTLGPGDQAFMPGQSTPFASNTNPRFGNRDDMKDYSALLGHLAPLVLAGSQVNAFGDPSAFGKTQVYSNAVNTANSILPLIQAALSGQTNAPAATASSHRVRVQGPQGETGTMDSSEPLPAGWKIIQ